MLRSLQNARLRRLLLLGAALLTILLVLVQGLVVRSGSWGELVRSIAETNLSNLVALTVTSGLALGFYHIFVREEEELIAIRALDAQASRVAHVEALASSQFWYAEGHIGRWVRDNVFSRFAKDAREGLQIREVRLALIDPRLEDLCAIHSVRRQAHLSRQEQRWDLSRVQAEICGTVLAAIAYSADVDRFRAKIYLKQGSAPFRSDISTTTLFLTQDDALAPTIAVRAGSNHYKTVLVYFQDYARNEPSAIELDISGASARLRADGNGTHIPASRYREAAKDAGLDFDRLSDPEFCDLVRSCTPALRGDRKATDR